MGRTAGRVEIGVGESDCLERGIVYISKDGDGIYFSLFGDEKTDL